MNEYIFQGLVGLVSLIATIAYQLLMSRVSRLEKENDVLWNKINGVDGRFAEKLEGIHKDIAETRLEFQRLFLELRVLIEKHIKQ